MDFNTRSGPNHKNQPLLHPALSRHACLTGLNCGLRPKRNSNQSFPSWFLVESLPLKTPSSHGWIVPTFIPTSLCFPYHAFPKVRQPLSHGHLICSELFQALQITFNPIHNAGCDSKSKLGQRKVILGEDPHRTRQFYHPHNTVSKLTAATDKTQTDILGGDLSTSPKTKEGKKWMDSKNNCLRHSPLSIIFFFYYLGIFN